MNPTRETARVIFKAGVKVEVSVEEEVWFPATIVEDFGNDSVLVEYNCLGINGESKLCRVTVDNLHIRPSVSQIRVASFGLLEKVDAFVDFGWLSGVITKKLADSRYLVYFKHTNKAKELGHLELRPHVERQNDKQFTPYQVPVSNDVEHHELRETVSLNFTNAIEDTTTCIDKQTSVVTTSMKRSKPTNLGSNSKPPKKSKAGISSGDPSLSNGSQSKEVSNPAVGQTFDKAENVSKVKKKLGKREKGVGLKRAMITSSKKKGRLSADSRGLKTLPQAAGDSTVTTTPNVVEKKHVTKTSPIPVIMGLQCYAVTVSRTKKPKELPSESPENVVESEEPQLAGVPLSPKATGNQERKETDGDTTAKKKRGRPFKTQPKTTLAVNQQNGDASVKKVPYRSGIELPLQQEKYDKPVKGKRGKRRMISLNSPASPQDVQDSSNQKEIENSEIIAEKLIDSMPDDQPLSKWFLEMQSLATHESTGKKTSESSKSLLAVTDGDGQTLTFEKRNALWDTMESMEAFRLFPQKPHFRPLDNIKESARERHAINKMVDFSSVFEDTRRLRIDHPRTLIEDHLETLIELEAHGFDVSFIRNRLTKLVSFKDKREGLESRSKEVKDSIGSQRVEVEKLVKEIEAIDKQVADLVGKRDRVLKEKEKKRAEIVGLEGEIGEIEEGMIEYRCKFEELATAALV